MKYTNDFTLYEHFIHALEYLGYNFDRQGSAEHPDARHHSFSGEDDEWIIRVDVTAVRKPPR